MCRAICSESIRAPFGDDVTVDLWMIAGRVYGLPVLFGGMSRLVPRGLMSGYEIQL